MLSLRHPAPREAPGLCQRQAFLAAAQSGGAAVPSIGTLSVVGSGAGDVQDGAVSPRVDQLPERVPSASHGARITGHACGDHKVRFSHMFCKQRHSVGEASRLRGGVCGNLHTRPGASRGRRA